MQSWKSGNSFFYSFLKKSDVSNTRTITPRVYGTAILEGVQSELKIFSEQPDLTPSALSKGLGQMGNSGGLF